MKIKEITGSVGDFVKYDETSKTGLIWKTTLGKRAIKDKVAGSLNITNGYYRICINEISYHNHRIIYFLHHGYCPECIDHIDGDPKNNNIDNLREATLSNNQYNANIRKDNSTGIKGLSISRNTHWHLKINKNGKVAFQEYYKLSEKTKDQCRIILEEKRKNLHGEYANNG